MFFCVLATTCFSSYWICFINYFDNVLVYPKDAMSLFLHVLKYLTRIKNKDDIAN